MPGKGGAKIVDELKKRADAATRNQSSQADGNIRKETSGQEPTEDLKPDIASAWKDRYIRLLADLENTKKRLTRASAQEVEIQKRELLDDVLQFADGLDLALKHISSGNGNRNIHQFAELLQDSLDNFFIKHDVKAIDALGEVFDPNFHEALGMIQHPEAAANTVVRVERKGYLYRDRLLRPAQVLVAAN